MKYKIGDEVHNGNFYGRITGIIKEKGQRPRWEYDNIETMILNKLNEKGVIKNGITV